MMKISVETEVLRNALNKVLSVVDKKTTRPILAFTLLEATSHNVSISATDLEISVKINIPAKVQSPGVICLNAKNLFEIVKELPNSTILLAQDENENNLKLFCEQIHYSLLIHKNDEYPQLIFSSEHHSTINIGSKKLLDIINKTSHAISLDETRLNLNGINLQKINGRLRAVATDGHRLSLLETELSEEIPEILSAGIIVPKKGIYEIKKIAETYPDSSIKVGVDESFIYLSALNEYFLSIRLIARDYPKYQPVIPNKTLFHLEGDRDKLLNAVKRIKIMSNEKTNGVIVYLKNNEATFAANHPSLGKAKETIPVSYQGKEMEIVLNAKFLIEALSVIEGDVSLEINNEVGPILLKSKNSPHYLGIVMPFKM